MVSIEAQAMSGGRGAVKSRSACWRVLLLTCRPTETDFRLPLAEALQAMGHEVAYVHLRRRPVLIEMSAPEKPRTFSLPGFLLYAAATFRPARRLLVFNSTNLVFPGLSRLLRLLVGGIWCFDMHDDLLYNRQGERRARMEKAQDRLLAGSDLVVHAAPTLAELFPRSRHLGNASTLTRLPREKGGADRLLVLASLDERLDFDFLSRVAELNPSLGIDIYGRVSEDDPDVAARLAGLTARHANVVHRGPYVNADLPKILSAYRVTLAPYVAAARLTRYIDPLRFYHCLNAGMEVVSTDIPGAASLRDRLHIVHSPEEVGPLAQRLASDPAARRNGDAGAPFTWADRAARLMEFVEETRAGRSTARAA